MHIPSLAERLPDLWLFLEEMAAGVKGGAISSAGELIRRCREFYTHERIGALDDAVPGWRRMASYADGKTLWHVNVAMVALLQLDEYRQISRADRVVLEWVMLIHDLAKEPVPGRDHRHAFRSAALAGAVLPKNGFPVSAAYQTEFLAWRELTEQAIRVDPETGQEMQDNSRLALIGGGAKRIFPEPTRAAVMSIALHQSLTSLSAWPVKAPLTDSQIEMFVDDEIRPLLCTLMLADSGGWNLFDPQTLAGMYEETREVFRRLPHRG